MNNYVAPTSRRFIRLITLVVAFVILLLVFSGTRSGDYATPNTPVVKDHSGESDIEHTGHGEPANPNIPVPVTSVPGTGANEEPVKHVQDANGAVKPVVKPTANADYNSFGESDDDESTTDDDLEVIPPVAPKPATPIPEASSAPAPPVKVAPAAPPSSGMLAPACAAYPKDASLVTVVKTGATEAFARLPTLLLTFLSCIPEDSMFIYSDMAQQLGPYQIHDSLATIEDKSSDDFDLYREQQALIANGGQIWELDSSAGGKAWKLDKYKNLHTAQGAWDKAPGRDWYLFVDADTYISWPGMFALLDRMKKETKDFYSKPLYVGSVVNDGSPVFPHGGSGYFLNKAAMEILVGDDRAQLATEYNKNASKECCGDAEIAKTLLKKGVKPVNVRPVISGDNMKDTQFGPKNWCHPIATMHHVGPEEVQKYWDFENKRARPQEPVLYEEFYHSIVEPRMGGMSRRDDWDNKSWPPKVLALDLFDSTDGAVPDIFTACQQACRAEPACFQWITWNQECAIESNFKLGVQRGPFPEHFTSGWFTDRIDAWISQNMGCKEPNWKPNHD